MNLRVLKVEKCINHFNQPFLIIGFLVGDDLTVEDLFNNVKDLLSYVNESATVATTSTTTTQINNKGKYILSYEELAHSINFLTPNQYS